MLDFELITDKDLEEAFAIAMMSDDELDEYIREHEEPDLLDVYEEDFASNMPCDFSGFCVGTDCPRFFNCH